MNFVQFRKTFCNIVSFNFAKRSILAKTDHKMKNKDTEP